MSERLAKHIFRGTVCVNCASTGLWGCHRATGGTTRKFSLMGWMEGERPREPVLDADAPVLVCCDSKKGSFWHGAPTFQTGHVNLQYLVIMDNLGAHKHEDIAPQINNAGALLEYLPAYSPDLNPIEKMWSKIKEFLRTAKAIYGTDTSIL